MSGFGFGFGFSPHGALLNQTVDGSPINLLASRSGDTSILLSWVIGSTNHDGHEIFISTDNITYTSIGTVTGSTNSYSAAGLTISTLYYFKVRAYKGASTYSELSNMSLDMTLDSSKAVARYNPNKVAGVVRDGVNRESIYWDLMKGSALRGAEESSGTTVVYGVYEITATEANHFFPGCAVGDIFPAASALTLDANNKVKRVIGNHLTQFTASKQPVTRVFDGVSCFMMTPTFTWNRPEVVYIVFKALSQTNLDRIFDGFGENSMALYQTSVGGIYKMVAGTVSSDITIAAGAYVICRFLYNSGANGSNSTAQVGDAVVGPFDIGTNNAAGFTLGKGGGGAANNYRLGNFEFKEAILLNVDDAATTKNSILTLLQNTPLFVDGSEEGETVDISVTQSATLVPITSYYTATAGAYITISWGDGTSTRLTCDGTEHSYTKNYAAAGTYAMKIGGELDKLIRFHTGGSPLGIDVSEFAKCANIEYLKFNPSVQTLVGDIGLNTKLKELWSSIPITPGAGITGSLNNCPDLEVFECQATAGNYFVAEVTGLYQNIPKLKQWCAVTKVTGVLTTLVDLEYFSWGYVIGNATTGTIQNDDSTARLTGDISNMTKLWFFACNAGAATLTGSTALLADMEYFGVPPLLTKPASLASMPKLSQFAAPPAWLLSETEVNQYIADIRANCEVVRTYFKNTAGTPYGVGTRSIDLSRNLSSAAPTGQGIIDKAYLNATKSPAVPGTGTVWTITTN